MLQDKKLQEDALAILLWGIGIGAALAGLGYLMIQVGTYVVVPTIHAVRNYFALYGRATAEVATVVTIIGTSLMIHDKIMTALVKDFSKYVEDLQLKLDEVTKFQTSALIEAEKLQNERTILSKENSLKDAKINHLKLEINSLQKEIELLKNPEAVALAEQKAEQDKNDQSLKAIADSIRWGGV